jgi:hypothetical protein
MTDRRFFNGPVPWLVGLLWADIGILFGMALCLAINRFPSLTANPAAYFAVFAIFGVAAVTTSIAISNRQDAERRALKRPIANACVGLYAVSLELQRYISTLQFVSHNDLNGRPVDIAALREATDGVMRAAAALAPSNILDPADVNRVLQAGQSVVADTNESFAAACQALDRAVYERRERWAAALRLGNGALVRIGKTVAALQARH